MTAGGVSNSISVLSCTSAATGIEVCQNKSHGAIITVISLQLSFNTINLADTIMTFTELKKKYSRCTMGGDQSHGKGFVTEVVLKSSLLNEIMNCHLEYTPLPLYIVVVLDTASVYYLSHNLQISNDIKFCCITIATLIRKYNNHHKCNLSQEMRCFILKLYWVSRR